MLSSFNRAVALVAGVALVLVLSAPPWRLARAGTVVEAAAADKKPPPPALPAGGVVVVADSMAEGLRLVPRAVLLTPEKYKELLDETARLRRLLGRARAILPSQCLLKGKVEGNLVSLQAQFEFVTEKPQALVFLACGQAQAAGVSLDGKKPQLLSGGLGRGREEAEGFSVEVEKPGEHQLTLDLVLALAGAPGGREAGTHGVTLDLPRAASTRLELELPDRIKDVRCGGKALDETLLTLKNRTLAGTLGAAGRLELSWKPTRAGAPVLAAEGLVQVRLDGPALRTEARLTLQVLGGQTKIWRLVVPLKAGVKVAPGDGPRVTRVDRSDGPLTSLWTIHLAGESALPLTVTVTGLHPRPRPGDRIPVGPFAVLGAARHGGSVLVSNTSADLHLDFHLPGDLRRRGSTEEERRRDPALVAAFRYGGVGEAEQTANAQPWLELEALSVAGQLKAQVRHALTLEPGEPPGGRPPEPRGGKGPHWQVATAVTVTPRWADVDRLVVRMPPGCEYDEEGSFPLPDRVRHVSYDPATRLVEFKLVRGGAEPALKPFTVTVVGTYPAVADEARQPDSPARQVALALPRPQGTIEQGGEVTVQAPPDVELLPVPRPAGATQALGSGLELVRQTTHQLTWRQGPRAPAQVEVRWRPYRPEVQVTGVADVTLTAREGRVRHELRFQLPDPTAQVALRVPAGVSGLRVLEGGQLGSASAGGRVVALLAAGVTPRLVLEYAFAPGRAATRGDAFPVPLVVPRQVTRCETKVRVWGEPGALPRVVQRGGRPWAELGVEEVPGRNWLPALVLSGQGVDLPLSLSLGAGHPAFTALVGRALLRADVGAGGVQSYRVGYRLSRLAARHLDVELPASGHAVGLRARLDGKQVDWEAVGESGEHDDGGRVARLRLGPELVRRGAVLELSYQLSPGQGGGSLLRTTLNPPRLRGAPGGAPTRWQVTVPAGWVLLGPEGGPGSERTWGRRGALLAPRLAPGAAGRGERWFAGAGGTNGSAAGEPNGQPAVACWGDGAAPLTLTHAPQQAWLLVCSLGLLLVGLGLFWLTWPGDGQPFSVRWVVWPALALLALAAAGAALLWPTAAGAVVYGCEPGAAVLLLAAAVQWLLHERYRRQVIFLPSFSRARSGSSLLRAEAARQPGEPSTVDAVPRPPGSSVERGS